MAKNIDTVISSFNPQGYWSGDGSVISGSLSALVPTGSPTTGASLFDAGVTTSATSVLLNGTTQYLLGATDSGSTMVPAINSEGFFFSSFFKLTDASIPSSTVYTLFSLYNSLGYGLELNFFANSLNNAASFPTIVFSVVGKTSTVTSFYINQYNLIADGSTYGAFSDQKPHHIAVYYQRPRNALVFFDGRLLVRAAYSPTPTQDDTNTPIDNFSYSNEKLCIGAYALGGTGSLSRFFKGTIQSPFVAKGLIAREALQTMLKSAWNSPRGIIKGRHLNISTASLFSDSAGTVPAVLGDPVKKAISADGTFTLTQTTTINAPYLRQDETGRKFLDFQNRSERRAGTSLGVKQNWMDCTLSQSILPSYIGMFAVCNITSHQQLGINPQSICGLQGSSVNKIELGVSQSTGQAVCTVQTTTRSPSSTDFPSVRCMPTISCIGFNIGATGLSASQGVIQFFTDGIIGSASGDALGDGTYYLSTYNTLRFGVTDVSNLSAGNTTCTGADMHLYEFIIPDNRPITDIEFQNARNEICGEYGIPLKPRAVVIVSGDSISCGEQDMIDYNGITATPTFSTGITSPCSGWLSRITGIYDCAVFNTSLSGDKYSEQTTTDHSYGRYHIRGIPTVGLIYLGTNDALNAAVNSRCQLGSMQSGALTLVTNMKNNSGTLTHVIGVKLGTSSGVDLSNNSNTGTLFNTWLSSTTHPFDAIVQAPSFTNTQAVSTLVTDGIHPSATGHSQLASVFGTAIKNRITAMEQILTKKYLLLST